MGILDKLKLDQLFRYAFGGGLLFFFAYICKPVIVGEMIKSMGVIFAPLFILGVGVAIYVFQRNVLGELFWYPLIHIVHYVLDINKRKDKKNCTSPMIYLNLLGIKKYFIRREAYTTIRRLFDFDSYQLQKNKLREKFDIAHGERHVLWITTNIFILFYCYIYWWNPSAPEIFSSIIKPSIIINSFNIAPILVCLILIFAAIISDIFQLRYECYIIRKYNEYGEVKQFLMDYKFINVKKEKK